MHDKDNDEELLKPWQPAKAWQDLLKLDQKFLIDGQTGIKRLRLGV